MEHNGFVEWVGPTRVAQLRSVQHPLYNTARVKLNFQNINHISTVFLHCVAESLLYSCSFLLPCYARLMDISLHTIEIQLIDVYWEMQ